MTLVADAVHALEIPAAGIQRAGTATGACESELLPRGEGEAEGEGGGGRERVRGCRQLREREEEGGGERERAHS